MTEDELLDGLIGAAYAGGWRVHHDRRADLALTQGTPGFPDLILAHDERRELLVIEAKSETGTFRPGQPEWLEAFRAAGVDARVVRPDDYEVTWRHLVGARLIETRKKRSQNA